MMTLHQALDKGQMDRIAFANGLKHLDQTRGLDRCAQSFQGPEMGGAAPAIGLQELANVMATAAKA